MKKNALALAVAGVMAGVASVPSVSMAGVGPTLYGQGHVSLDVVDNGDTKDTNLSSNTSRIGVKGSYDLGNGLAAIYLFEWQVAVTDSRNEGTLKARNRYIGLKSDSYGTLVGGRHDTPMKVIGRKVDLFWSNQLGNNRNITTINGHDLRADNVIGYISPNFGPVHAFLAYVTDHDLVNQKSGNTDSHQNNAWSGALIYEQNGLFLAAGYEKFNVDNRVNPAVTGNRVFTDKRGNAFTVGGNDSTEAFRVVGKYNMNDWTFTAFWERDLDAQFLNSNDQDLAGAGLAYKMGSEVFKGQVYWAGESDKFDNNGAVNYSVGWDHYFSKSVQTYIQGTLMANDDNASLQIGGSGGDNNAILTSGTGHGNSSSPTDTDENVWGISAGMRIKF